SRPWWLRTGNQPDTATVRRHAACPAARAGRAQPVGQPAGAAGAAGSDRTRLSARHAHAGSAIVHRDQGKPCRAGRQLGDKFVVDALLQRGSRNRRVDADPALFRVGLVRADDAVEQRFTRVDVLEFDGGAEEHLGAVAGLALGHFQRGNPLAEVTYAAIDLGELLLPVNVFGV